MIEGRFGDTIAILGLLDGGSVMMLGGCRLWNLESLKFCIQDIAMSEMTLEPKVALQPPTPRKQEVKET